MNTAEDTMNTCRLCPNSATKLAYDQPLLESSNFIVVPSLGALVEGWLLLLPKKHFICNGALPGSLTREFDDMKNATAAYIRSVYGSVCAFEHGPHEQRRDVGCGVDHAHLHLLPGMFDLRSVVSSFVPEDTNWTPADLTECRTAYLRSKDYLYFEQDISNGYIAMNDSFGSQLFRRGIARELGVPDEYNWREFQHLNNIERTITRARQFVFPASIAAGGLEAAA